MSEQNNNTIEYKECDVCYENRDCECFNEGVNCEHSVCVYCSERITKCPFCRKRWTEYEEDEDEGSSAYRNIRSLQEMRLLVGGRRFLYEEGTPRRNAIERNLAVIREQIETERNRVLFQVRINDDEFAHNNEEEWQFTTEEHAREIYSNVMDDIQAGDREDIDQLRITRTPLLDEDEWNTLFEEDEYPLVTLEEWNRPAVEETEETILEKLLSMSEIYERLMRQCNNETNPHIRRVIAGEAGTQLVEILRYQNKLNDLMFRIPN